MCELDPRAARDRARQNLAAIDREIAAAMRRCDAAQSEAEAAAADAELHNLARRRDAAAAEYGSAAAALRAARASSCGVGMLPLPA